MRAQHRKILAEIEPEPSVTITLSHQDARVLRALCGWVEGDPAGPRGALHRIAGQLDRQGVAPAIQIFREVKVEFVATWPGGAA